SRRIHRRVLSFGLIAFMAPAHPVTGCAESGCASRTRQYARHSPAPPGTGHNPAPAITPAGAGTGGAQAHAGKPVAIFLFLFVPSIRVRLLSATINSCAAPPIRRTRQSCRASTRLDVTGRAGNGHRCAASVAARQNRDATGLP